jgi:hypothetical protein
VLFIGGKERQVCHIVLRNLHWLVIMNLQPNQVQMTSQFQCNDSLQVLAAAEFPGTLAAKPISKTVKSAAIFEANVAITLYA